MTTLTPQQRKRGNVPLSAVENLCQPAVIDLSDSEDDDDVRILNFIPQNTPFGKRRKKGHINTTSPFFERGECSKDAPFVCEKCKNTKTVRDSFSIRGCFHAYCSWCVAMYIGSKLRENVINIGCPVPECSGLLEAEYCCAILPAKVLVWWHRRRSMGPA